MVDPIRDDADVFGSLRFAGHLGPPRCIPDVANPELSVRNLLADRFQAVSMDWRDETDKANGIQIRTAGVPCMHLVEEWEARHEFKYKYIMFLRGDVVYKNALPPFSQWPDLDPIIPFVFVEDCVGGTDAWGLCLDTELPGNNLGCVTDSWALMTRSTAPIYYQDDWDLKRVDAEARRKRGKGCRKTHIYECGLGCALHQDQVSVRPVRKRGTVLHNDLPEDADVEVNGTLSLEPQDEPPEDTVGMPWATPR